MERRQEGWDGGKRCFEERMRRMKRKSEWNVEYTRKRSTGSLRHVELADRTGYCTKYIDRN